MANRSFQTQMLGLMKRPVQIYANVLMKNGPCLQYKTYPGGSGVVTADAPTTGVGYAVGNREGVRSVTRTGVGAWTFVMSDPYRDYAGVELCLYYSALGTAPSIATCTVNALVSNCTANNGTGDGGIIAVKLCDFAGAVADPTNDDSLFFRFTFGDATEP